MPRIIEIWRDTNGMDIPVKFTVGEVPQVLNENGNLVGIEGSDPPVVKKITHVHGAFGNKAYRGCCFIVEFEDTDVRRVVPEHVVVDIGYHSEATTIASIKEDKETATETPDLPEE
jgi:hypothetical protein